jgi:hypothetical protein
MSWESVCVCAAVQAAPSLRIQLASSATSRERGARRKQDVPMRPQAGRGRVLVRSCRVRATRLNVRPNFSAYKVHVRCAMHQGCMRAASCCWITSRRPRRGVPPRRSCEYGSGCSRCNRGRIRTIAAAPHTHATAGGFPLGDSDRDPGARAGAGARAADSEPDSGAELLVVRVVR